MIGIRMMTIIGGQLLLRGTLTPQQKSLRVGAPSTYSYAYKQPFPNILTTFCFFVNQANLGFDFWVSRLTIIMEKRERKKLGISS
jgi:hypothetical protein